MRIPAHTWLVIAAMNCAIGATTAGVVYLTESPSPRPPLIGTTTTEKSRGSNTTVPYKPGETTIAPPGTSGSLATTTLYGSPFTTPSSTPLSMPPPADTQAPTTAVSSTVAPCQPCPQFDYAVLAATTVTNTGPTSIIGGVGLWPGTAVTGFPPGIAVIDTGPDALAAQSALTDVYLDALLRPPDLVPSQLGGQHLNPGTYADGSRGPLSVDGTLTLDGAGTYIFQTDSTLITASGSRVELVNGARACDITWQVGSSATLGTGSSFAGTIMALTSITVTTGVQVRGRALARNGAVTLDSDTFTGC